MDKFLKIMGYKTGFGKIDYKEITIDIVVTTILITGLGFLVYHV